MRGDQLAAMVAPRLADRLRVRVLPFHAGLMPPLALRATAQALAPGSVAIFVKSAALGLTPDHLAPLRRRGIVVGFDSIDTPLDEIDFALFDFHIAASLAGKAALEARIAALGLRDLPVELLHHHADPRLATLRLDAARPFRCGYVGERKNALLPADIAGEVECIEVRFARDFPAALAPMARLTLHYGVRPGPPADARQYKPFTKGFTAAACGANILVNREADDAVALLGEDYPFLVSASDPADIAAGFDRAKESFGTPLWQEGLARMRRLPELVTPEALAQRLREIVDRVVP